MQKFPPRAKDQAPEGSSTPANRTQTFVHPTPQRTSTPIARPAASAPEASAPITAQRRAISAALARLPVYEGPISDWTDAVFRPDLYQQPVMRKSANESTQNTPLPPPSGSGKAMPEDVQAKMESSLGADFSQVRIHEGAHAPALGALAYTQGTDIHFAPGQYAPDSPAGQELLGHELTHVVQQSQGRVQPTTQIKSVAVNDDSSLEREADAMGARAARGEEVHSAAADGSLSRVRSGEGVHQMKKSKKVSSQAMRRLEFARAAIKHTKKVLHFGAGNQAKALKKTKFNSYWRMKVMRAKKYWVFADEDVKKIAQANPEALIAAKADIAHGGNCGEHADIAFDYLRVKAEGETINTAAKNGLDHQFMLLGNLSSELDDSQIAVADPWPTQPTATLWEDHFAYTPDRKELEVFSTNVADGKNVKEVIAAGLKLTDEGKQLLEKKLSKEATRDEISQGLGDWIWEHESAAADGKEFKYVEKKEEE